MKKLSWLWVFSILFLTVSAFARSDNRSRSSRESSEVENQHAAEEAEVEVESFKKAARSDKDMRLDCDGRALYVCQAMPTQVGPDTTTYTSTAAYPLSQTFLLHSRPGAAKVIYLDFKGHVTSGTSWNTTYAGGANITTPAFDTDGNSTNFSASEQAVIHEVWKRVAEDYAPWDIDVTTQDPGLEAIRRLSVNDTMYGVRCVIGGSSSQWLGSLAGGVAYIGSFGRTITSTTTTNDVPAFVFSSELSNNAKYIAEAASHEIGHTLGLYHSSQTNGNEYYAGHADWAPIMGVGYYSNVVQWTKGDYPLSNNTQDQMYLITLRIPPLTDEHGASAATASVVVGDTLAAGGVINYSTDLDWFKISTGQGTVNINGLTSSPSANLKLALSLVDESGNVLATGTSSGMNCNLSVPVLGGNYYIVVDGVGTGDALTGYTDYASVGRFSLSGSWTAATVANVVPVALTSGTTPTSGTAPLNVSFVGSNSYDPDGVIASYLWNFGDGTTSTLSNVSHTYSVAGTYNASLTVTDNSGARSVGTISIMVAAVPPVVSSKYLKVSSMVTSWVRSTSTTGYASCKIRVLDQTGNAVRNASVNVTVSGLLSGTATATTDSSGYVTINSSRISSSLKGTITFGVTNLSLSGYIYDATKNTLTSTTLTR
jgi:PKD repeat protein